MKTNDEKRVLWVSCVGIALNISLFFVKLYIGLSVNSISIFSDAVNNGFDSLSAVLTCVCMAVALKNRKNGVSYINGKLEQTLSFLLSLIVSAVGISFLYSSIERLMYPTPIFFSQLYFGVIAFTVAVKLGMAVFYSYHIKKCNSLTLRVMRTDSFMDAAVTSVTLVGFLLVNYTEFTVDAFAGIAVSIFILCGAISLVVTSLKYLLNYVKKDTRLAFEEEVSSMAEIKHITYTVADGGKIVCYIQFGEGTIVFQQLKDIGLKYNIETLVVQVR